MDNMTLPPDFPARIQASVRKLGLRKLKFYQMSRRWQQRPAWQGLWCMGLILTRISLHVGFPPFRFSFLSPAPFPLSSRRYSWIFQPGKEKFLNVMIMAGSRRWGGAGERGWMDRQIPIDMKTSPDELVSSA